MANDSKHPKEIFLQTTCPYPSCRTSIRISVPSNTEAQAIQTSCPKCGATIKIPIISNSDGRKAHYQDAESYTVHVFGNVASEVESVAKSLIKEIEVSKTKKDTQSRNPWISGSFYLAGAIIIGTLLLIIAKNVNLWALPIVIIGTLLLVSIVGALQLRQDASLSQKNFLSLMLMTFRQIPFIQFKEKTSKK
jgi:hypothetical protein